MMPVRFSQHEPCGSRTLIATSIRQQSRSRPLVDRELMPPREVFQVEEACDRNSAVMQANHAAVTGDIITDHITIRDGRKGGAWGQGEGCVAKTHGSVKRDS
jgi:hypothetical protein